MLALLDSFLPELVQTALSTAQSVVGLRAMVTASSPLGCTVNSHLLLGVSLCGWVRRTAVTLPLVMASTSPRAFYGIIALVDSQHGLLNILFSGMSDEEVRQIFGVPQGEQLFRHLSEPQKPLRVDDFQDYLRSQGISGWPVTGRYEVPIFSFRPNGYLISCTVAPVRSGSHGLLSLADFAHNSATFGSPAPVVVRGEAADAACFWQSSS